MARAGVGSRRACEVLIEAGMVTVNGETVHQLPCLVDPYNDRIEVQGRVLQKPERHVYVMLYKPKQTMCTLADPGGRRTVADLVNHPSGTRLYPVGRLDFDTMGLVLMTNDGELANKLTHPRFGVHKTYRAVVKGSLSDEEVERLEQGIYLAERREGRTVGARRTARAKLMPVKREPTRTILDIELHEGRNRQIRRMMASAGCPVKRLVRIQMGPIALKGLQIGEWRELTSSELAKLRKAARGGDAGEAQMTTAGMPRKPPKGGRKPGTTSGSGVTEGESRGSRRVQGDERGLGRSGRDGRSRERGGSADQSNDRPARAFRPSPKSASLRSYEERSGFSRSERPQRPERPGRPNRPERQEPRGSRRGMGDQAKERTSRPPAGPSGRSKGLGSRAERPARPERRPSRHRG